LASSSAAAAVSSSPSAVSSSPVCENCGRTIPSASMQMHALRCAKEVSKCRRRGCGVVVRVADADAHTRTHDKTTCTLGCGHTVSNFVFLFSLSVLFLFYLSRV
jgi:hypothetical protein